MTLTLLSTEEENAKNTIFGALLFGACPSQASHHSLSDGKLVRDRDQDQVTPGDLWVPVRIVFFAFSSSSSRKPPKGFKQMSNISGHTGYGVESGLGHEEVKMWLTKAGKR